MRTPLSPILGPAVQAVSPLALLMATYLLFAGHNSPGGGFAAGLVIAAVIALRRLADLPFPTVATPLIATGIIVIVVVATAPMLFGNPLLDQSIWKLELPLLGTVKSGSALPFDIGVTAIVVGLVMAQLDGPISPPSPPDADPQRREEALS